jgi:predicted RNA-binding Zn ribbon-like protein
MSSTAPGDLELLRQFVNTVDPDEHTDALDTAEHLESWLVDHGLFTTSVPLDPEDYARVLGFRESVRHLARSNSRSGPDAETITSFNDLAGGTRLMMHLSPEGSAELVAEGSDLERALGRLLKAIYDAMLDGNWRRLKACSKDSCGWLYFDHSKNRSKKWCTMESCGNVVNARAYRSRRREG